MRLTIGILTVGSELLDGRVLDTNAHYLCDELTVAGLNVITVISCPDDIKLIKKALLAALEECSHVIITGGLGPTTDDLTRESVAELFNRPLEQNDEALEQIKDTFRKRRRDFEPSNQKQALFPKGAHVIPNCSGTAPGFWIEDSSINNKTSMVCSLPGVPGEMKPMFQENVLPRLKSFSSGSRPLKKLNFKMFGLPESVIGARVNTLGLPDDIIVSYRASFPEIHVILKFPDGKHDEETLRDKVSAAIGSEWIFTDDLSLTIEHSVHKLLIERELSIVTAESCTAGMISSLLTNCAGASAYFRGGFVCYSNELKESLLGVPAVTIEKSGAVSHKTAEAMARGALEKLGADLALSITGIAGPDGGTKEKPVGTFYLGLATRKGCTTHHYFYPGSRSRVRRYSAYMALDLVRRHLLNLPPQPDSPQHNE